MAKDALDLRFGPTGSSTGFTPRGIAEFSGLRPEAVVRELVQNSLDAAVEAGENAIIRFNLSRQKTKSVPKISSYRTAFRSAVKSQGNLQDPAQQVVDIIDEALRKDECDVLTVLDNGIGLDRKRMAALLGDGVSVKSEDSTGTFGNGHSVAIPASDLRYILYGGIARDGTRIGSGHAVLASWIEPGEDYRRSGDGFLCHGFQKGDCVPASNSSIPAFIDKELDNIWEDSKQGAAVIIPHFNNFRESGSLWDMVYKSVSCNFLQAIADGHLDVWVQDSRPGHCEDPEPLDQFTLKDILQRNRHEKRARAFLSGHNAFEAYETLCSGYHHTVETCIGQLDVRLRFKESGNSRVDLFRNGMWITNDRRIAHNYTFPGRAPFHALLMLDSSKGRRLHKLVRSAEGPLHDKLEAKRLSPENARYLRKAFREIFVWIQDTVPEVSSDAYSPDDFLTFDFGDDGDVAEGKARRSFWGTPTTLDRRDPGMSQRSPDSAGDGSATGSGKGGEGGDDGGGGADPDPRSQPVRRPFFQAVSIPDGIRRLRIHVECQKKCDNAELRLFVDENVDATCDRPRRDEVSPVGLSGLKINGEDVSDDRLVRENGRVVGVRLGDLTEDSSVLVHAGYELPEHVSTIEERDHVLRVEVFRPPPSVKPEPSNE